MHPTHWLISTQVTVRNAKGRRMLDKAIESGRVEILQRGGAGGRELPSTGDRRQITVKTVQGDSMVKTLLEPDFVAGSKGAPPFVANILADLIARTLPTGLEFARYSIDYHYLRSLRCAETRRVHSIAAASARSLIARFARRKSAFLRR